jgi:hypothetical protein
MAVQKFKTLDLAELNMHMVPGGKKKEAATTYAALPYNPDNDNDKGMGNHRDLFLLPKGVAYECQDADTAHDKLFGANLSENEYYRRLERENRVTEAQSKLKRVTLGYDYSAAASNGLEPRKEFFEKLLPKRGPRLKMLIADTILGCRCPESTWMYTSADGEVCKAQDYENTALMHRFGDSTDRMLPVAVMKKTSSNSFQANDVKVINTADLAEMLADQQAAAGKFGSDVVIQQFIKCAGSKPWIARTTWIRGRPPKCMIISNRRGFNKPAEDRTLESQLCTSISSPASCAIQVTPSAKDCVETVELVERIVKFGEKNIRPVVSFEEMAADFIRDPSGRWWLLQVKAFKLAKQAIQIT